METLDEIKARLLSRAAGTQAAHTVSTPTAHRQDQETTATLTDAIKARLMQRASPAEDAQTLSTQTGHIQNGESMTTLTDEIKEFIVKGLACFDTPSQLAEAVRVTFGIEITRQQAFAYDPAGSRPPAQRWRELHAATRARFLREVAEIGVAHKAVRLRMLDRLAHRCERNGVALALASLEQAAKECGGIYENRRPVVVLSSPPQPSPLPPSLPPQGLDRMIESTPLPQLPDLHGAAVTNR